MDILEKFNSPYLGVCFDTGHANLTGRFKEEFLILKDKIFTFHIHDNDGKSDSHLALGEGNIQWEKILKLLPKNATWGLEMKRIEDLEKSLGFLSTVK